MKKQLLILSAAILILGTGCQLSFSESTYKPAKLDENIWKSTEQTDSATTTEAKDAELKNANDVYISSSRTTGINQVYGFNIQSNTWFQLTDGTGFYEPIEKIGDTWLAKSVMRDVNGRGKSNGGLVFGNFNDEGNFVVDREIINFPAEIIDVLFYPQSEELFVLTGYQDNFYFLSNASIYKVDSSTGRSELLIDNLNPEVYTGYQLRIAYQNKLYFNESGGDGGCWWGTLYELNISTKAVNEIQDLSGCVGGGSNISSEVGSIRLFGVDVVDDSVVYYVSKVVLENGNLYEDFLQIKTTGETKRLRREAVQLDYNLYSYIDIEVVPGKYLLEEKIVRGNGSVLSRKIDLLKKDGTRDSFYECVEDCSSERIMLLGNNNSYVSIPNGNGARLISLPDKDVSKNIQWPDNRALVRSIRMLP